MFEQDGSLNVTYSLYRLLEVRPPCNDDDITRAYRKLALKYHPDKAGGCPDKFNQIKTAHDILKDPIKREVYDRFGDSAMKLLSPFDASPMNQALDTSTFLGRFILRILARPTRIIPYFLVIAAINLCFVTFMHLLDRKMYFEGLKTVPWYAIFSLLWIYLLSFVLLFGLFAFLSIRNFKVTVENLINTKEFAKIPESGRRFLSIAKAISFVAFPSFLAVICLLFIYSTSLMAIYFDDVGKLTGEMTWSKLYYPTAVFENLFAVSAFIFAALTIIRYQNPERLWSERLIHLGGYVLICANMIFYNYFILQFFDTNNTMLLFGAYAGLYLTLIYFLFQNHYTTKWEEEDLAKELIEQHGEASSSGINYAGKKRLQSKRRMFYVSTGIALFDLVLHHLHYAGCWPKSWSMTFLILMLCVYSSIVVFGLALPLIVVAMNMIVPVNSFDIFDSASPGEEGITVIDIPTRFYIFGYGFAPLQLRIRT